MDEIRAARSVLAEKLATCIVSENSLKPGQHIVIFIYDARNHEAEIVYRGIFMGWQHDEDGRKVVLAKVPDDDDDEEDGDTVEQRVIEGTVVTQTPDEEEGASAIAVPEVIAQNPDHEPMIIPIMPRYVFADGKKYATKHRNSSPAQDAWRALGP